MQVRVGTSGFSYKEWKGSFYPEKLPAKDMLAYYAGRLSAVEINNTFYRMPKASVLEGWAERVPAHFRFSIKASRRITHHRRLEQAGEEVSYLLSQLDALGDKLGVVLFQLPPNLRADLDRLRRFLDVLPEACPCAFEFRHPSWLEEGAATLLHERGAAVCAADTEDEPAGALSADAPVGYLRLRREDYEAGDLTDWSRRLRDLRCEQCFVFFKHEQQGPRLAVELQALCNASAMRSVRPEAGAARRATDPASA